MAKKKEELISLIKHTLRSVGEKKEQIDLTKNNKKEMYFPSLYLSVKQLPELEGYEVEDSITLIIKGVIKSHSVREEEDDEKRENFDIEIKKIGLIK